MRVRPLTADEANSQPSAVSVHDRSLTIACGPADSGGTQTFAFEHVFGPAADQLDVFSACGAPLVEQLFDGYNATVFAYGQARLLRVASPAWVPAA